MSTLPTSNADSSPENHQQRPRRRARPSKWLLVPMGMTLVLGIAAWWLGGGWRQADRPEIPSPDVTAANVQVAAVTRQLEQLVREQPLSASAWGKYGEVLMAHEWNAEALHCFQQAATLDPSDMRWPYLAAILLDRSRPLEAVGLYEQAQALDPEYAPLYLRLGNTLQRLDRVVEAEASLRQAADLAKQQPQPLVGLARLASARNDWQRASQLLEQAVQLAPENREARVELTRARLMLGTAQPLSRDEQTAVLSGEKYQPMPDPILQAVNEQEVAARLAAMQADDIAAQGDLSRAAEAYAELIQKRPDLARPRLNLASIYMSQRQLPLALATLREATRLFPDDAMAHFALSYALEASQQTAEARRELQEAVRLKPDYAEAHFSLGLAAERDGDLAQAIAAYRQAVQSDARMAQAHLALGLALQKSGQLDEAIVAMQAAVRLAPNDPFPKSYLDKALAERRSQPALIASRDSASIRAWHWHWKPGAGDRLAFQAGGVGAPSAGGQQAPVFRAVA